MFDTMTLTKATGAVCGSLLVFLLGGWAAEAIYSIGSGHGDQVQGYVVDTGEEEAPEETEDTGPDLPALFASAEASKGERVFNQCKACHQLEDGANGVGPHLYGVVGRDVQAVSDYSYSGALGEVADVWSAENLYAFLENPAEYAPGTSMGYGGLSSPEDRVNLIAYLDQSDGTDDITIETSAEETSGDEAAAMEEQATEEVAEQEAASEPEMQEGADGEMAEAAPAGDAASDEGAADDAATEDVAAEETAAEDAATEEVAAEEAATDGDTGDASGFAAMVASADVDAGKKVFRQCSACHAVEPGKNMVGPSMHGVVGREIASAEGFRYSDALMGLDGAWTPDELSAWLKNPREYASGNRMGYPGLKDEQDRANVIAYLDSLDD